MSTTYKVIAGDTFETIARKSYGDENESSRIKKANPGTVEPLAAGISIVVPDLPGAPEDLISQAAVTTEDEVSITIDGNRFRFWGSVRITRSIDAIDAIEFSAPFDSSAPGFKETFRPFSYKRAVVYLGGSPLFTGVMFVTPLIEQTQKTISLSCYSKPGVMGDCTAPSSAFPLEFNNLTLPDIAENISGLFGISVDFRADAGAPFERVALNPGQKVLSFLIGLANQRNMVVSSNEKGGILFWQSAQTGKPVAILRKGESPLLSVTPVFKGQDYYSSITGMEPVLMGLKGAQYTVKNDRLEGIVRPYTFVAPDTEDADLNAAVDAKVGRMFANSVTYEINVATWRDPSGNVWEPNTTLKLIYDDAMIYTEYEFLIKSVDFIKTAKSETATLNLVLPGAFSGQIPDSMPWED